MRLNLRIQALEQNYSPPAALTLIFVGLKRHGEDAELLRVRNESGQLFERMQEESHDAFITRARSSKQGLVLLTEVAA